jgi:xanthine dehydrogenase accessory factor
MNDLDIFRKAASLLGSGQSVGIVTVVATTGSTPGKAGYKMLVFDEGKQTAGTVGGGLVEARMIEEAAKMLGQPGSRPFRFELGRTPDDENGLCGGSIELLVETFDPSSLPLVSRLVAAAQEDLARTPTVVLCGAGHVSYHIARHARAVHFRVTVCDDRPEYANAQRFPDADQIVVEEFDRIFDGMDIDDRSYVVIVTRGHKWDEVVLERALATKARYIGMIGSRRKTLTILENLAGKGVPKESLAKVYSPIGVSIGAVTPEEIALSVVCELVKVRRLGDGPSIGHMTICRPEEAP